MGTTTPTATTTMARSFHLLAFLVIVTSTAGQISFGGGSEVRRQEKVVKEEKVIKVLSTKPQLQTVNFASNERKKKKPAGSGGRVSLAELLEGEQQLPPRVSSRFAFGGSAAVGKVGQGCTTPSGQVGSCNYITASQCRPVLETILKRGIDRAMLNYLIKAISFPCGFEDFDFTLCCAGPSTSTATESTTSTTTTTTTTTSAAPAISCGVVPPISNIVAPDAIRLL